MLQKGEGLFSKPPTSPLHYNHIGLMVKWLRIRSIARIIDFVHDTYLSVYGGEMKVFKNKWAWVSIKIKRFANLAS